MYHIKELDKLSLYNVLHEIILLDFDYDILEVYISYLMSPIYIYGPGPLLLTWIVFNSSLDK